jgi:hypothetical protein
LELNHTVNCPAILIFGVWEGWVLAAKAASPDARSLFSQNQTRQTAAFAQSVRPFMTVPLFIELQSTLLNLAFVESAYVEDTTLYVAVSDEVHEFEYEDNEQAARALLELRSLLASRNLLIGSVK